MLRAVMNSRKWLLFAVGVILALLGVLSMIDHKDAEDASERISAESSVQISAEQSKLGNLEIHFQDFTLAAEDETMASAACTFLFEPVGDSAYSSDIAIQAVIGLTDLVTIRQTSLILKATPARQSEETITFFVPVDWKQIDIVFSSASVPKEAAAFCVVNIRNAEP